MYEYRFVKIDLDGVMTKKPKDDYHRVFDQYSREGWRLVQIFAPSVSVGGGGIPNYFELIFEKEIE